MSKEINDIIKTTGGFMVGGKFISELEFKVKEIHKTKSLLNNLLRELAAMPLAYPPEVRIEVQDVVNQKYQQIEISVLQEIYP